jgi:hypothetical protein
MRGRRGAYLVTVCFVIMLRLLCCGEERVCTSCYDQEHDHVYDIIYVGRDRA